MTLLCYVQLTGLSNDVVSLNKELAQLKTENVILTAQYAQMFDLDTVKEAAESVGMAKPSSGQTYYMGVYNADDPWSKRLMKDAPCEKFSYAEKAEADLRAEEIELGADHVARSVH